MTKKGKKQDKDIFHAPSSDTSAFRVPSSEFGRQKILIVDDRKENLVALRQILSEVDAEVIEAASGNEALAATLDHDFALAILDVQMPGMSGYELAEHLRGDKNIRVLPIVFLTASRADEHQMFKGYAAGGIDYITKPYPPEVLRGKVNVFLEIDRYRRELEMHRDHLETLVAEQTATLEERVKEIKCLYAISSLVAEPRKSIDETLKVAVDLLPSGRQYPEITCARIVFEGREFATANFRDTAWKQSADIIVSGKTVGTVEVCYLKERSTIAEGPFLTEERDLIIDIARQLGVMIGSKRAEEALRESEGKYRSLVRAVVDPVIMVNARGDVLLINDAGAVLFKKSASEILNQNILNLMPEKQARVWRETIEKVIASRTPTVLVHWHNARYFESVFAPVTDPEGRAFAVTIIARDLTDRKLDEEEIEKLARFPAEDPYPVLRVTKDGIILYCNAAGKLLLKNWKCQVGETLPEKWRTHVAGVFGSDEVADVETECGGKTFSLTFGPVTESGYINIYGMDITKRKEAEDALQQSEDQLRQAQKMEAIGRLAGGIAHDFNNLLTAITGFSDLTLDQLPEGSSLRDDIETIKKAAFRAAALTRQLLAFSRRQALQPQILNLNELINNLDKMLRRIIGEDIQIVSRLAEKIPRVKADPGQIEQVIMNLVVNARDAMPDGGAITIVTENVSLDRDAAAIIPESHPGRFIRLSLEDTGTGIDPQVIEHIFEPFFTTKKVAEGTGLGLSTVYGIVKQHGGWINVYSDPGQGSVFKMYLPAFDVETGGETEETGSREPPRGEGEKILVVEDEKGVRNFLARVFHQYGYVVLAADTIAEGEKIFNEHPGGIDLLFTDVLLTDGSGLRLAQQLRGRQPDLAILLCSGYSDGHFRWTTEDKETFRLLQKPCSLYDLLSAVKDVLRERTGKMPENDAGNKS